MIEQKDELRTWCKNTQGNKKGSGRVGKDAKTRSTKTGHLTKIQVSAAVAKELKKLAKQEDVQPVEFDVDAHIAALVKDALSKQVEMASWSTLHTILEQALNK